MVNLGDSFTKFPNDLLEALYAQKLTGAQVAALLYIIRKTHGFGKGDFGDAISEGKIAEATGYSRRGVVNVISDMEKMGILEVERSGRGRLSSMRVRDVSEWDKGVNHSSQV